MAGATSSPTLQPGQSGHGCGGEPSIPVSTATPAAVPARPRWSYSSGLAPRNLSVRMHAEAPEVAMSQPVGTTRNTTRECVRTILLACGPLSALSYVGWRELAVALRWEGYSRIANAISELQLTGSPTKSFLDPWEGWVYSGLVAAFGVGVWLSAEGKWSLRVVAIAMVMPLATAPLWALFGEASLAAHIGLVLVGIGTWLVAMGFAAAALGKRFRTYTLVTLAMIVVFNGLALSYVADVD